MDPDEWTEMDAVNLRTFISDNPKFLRSLARKRPKIEGTTMEARAVTGSDANGFLAAIEQIEAMQQSPVPKSEDAGFISN